MARQRDYKAEYARRVERGRELGLSRPQARGHARASEPKASTVIQQIKVVQPERVAPKRKATAKPAPEPRQPKQPRELKEPRGKHTTARISQGSHNKARKETFEDVPAIQYSGSTESRLGNVAETIARNNANAHVIVSVTDKEGVTHTLGSHGGWNAATLASALQNMSIEDIFDDISGGPGSLAGGIESWDIFEI